ncbi:MAG: FGGY family carbohydrate kinase [Acidimicrobiales bacterium]
MRSTWCARRRGSCSIRTSRAPRSNGCSETAASRSTTTCCSAPSTRWLVWKLTGGVHATDPSNASRTMLFDIRTGRWSDEMCDLLGVPNGILPEVLPSSGRFGVTTAEIPTGSRACPSAASPAISRPRCSGKPASPRVRRRTPTAPDRSC